MPGDSVDSTHTTLAALTPTTLVGHMQAASQVHTMLDPNRPPPQTQLRSRVTAIRSSLAVPLPYLYSLGDWDYQRRDPRCG